MNASERRFEQGPIRPPSEAGSLLLRFTRNCPWNKCAFCPVYKSRTFSRRSLEEIRGDIDAVRAMLDGLRDLSHSMGFEGRLDKEVLNRVMTDSSFNEQQRQVAYWAARGQGNVFIQDANSLILKTSKLADALRALRSTLPEVQRVTSYARSSTVAGKSQEELEELKEAGLDRLHIGMESGSNEVLALVNKRSTAEQHIEAGRKVVRSGITLSEYIMPGLGGRAYSREHALETARVLNEINPHFIRVRTLHVIPGTPLHDMLRNGDFEPLDDDEIVREIRLLIDGLQSIESRITSDHVMNLLEEVQGTLPQDKPEMLQRIDAYLAMPQPDRLLYRLGRRGGAIRSPRDLSNPSVRSQLERAKQELETQQGKGLEEIIREMGRQYL